MSNSKKQQDELNDVFMNSLELMQGKIVESVEERIRERFGALRVEMMAKEVQNVGSVTSRLDSSEKIEVISRNLLNQLESFKKGINLKISGVMDELRNVVSYEEYEQKCGEFERQIKKFNKRDPNLLPEDSRDLKGITLGARIEDLSIKYKSLKNLVNKLILDSNESWHRFDDKRTGAGSFHSGRVFSTHDAGKLLSEASNFMKISKTDVGDGNDHQFEESFNSKLDKTQIKDIGESRSGKKDGVKGKRKSKSIKKKRKNSKMDRFKKKNSKDGGNLRSLGSGSGRFNRPKIKR